MSPTSSPETTPATRTVASTQSEMTEIILPNDANILGNLLGGRLMHFIDLTAGHGRLPALARLRRHCRDGPHRLHPAGAGGNLLTLKSSVNRAFTSSMEVGVRVWAENPLDGMRLHVASAYLVFVAVDQNGERVQVPRLLPETADEQRRYADALLRREHREAESARRKQEKIAAASPQLN